MNEIKEKLLKEIEEDKDIINWAIDNQDNYSKGKNDGAFIKEVGRMLIKKAIEETSKAKDEEFNNILDEIKNKIDDRINELTENCYQKQKGICVQCDAIEFELKNWINTIEEIKQRIKEE